MHLHFCPFEEEHLRGGALLLFISVICQNRDRLDVQGKKPRPPVLHKVSCKANYAIRLQSAPARSQRGHLYLMSSYNVVLHRFEEGVGRRAAPMPASCTFADGLKPQFRLACLHILDAVEHLTHASAVILMLSIVALYLASETCLSCMLTLPIAAVNKK